MSGTAARVAARNLSRSTGSGKSARKLVDEVTAAFPEGGFTGLIGPNGSGKSTLLRLLAGLYGPSGGHVLLDGADLADLRRRDIARRVAVTAQEVASEAEMTVMDVVLLGRLPHRRGRAAPSRHDLRTAGEAMAHLGVEPLAERVWSTLSGGERQRVNIARALAQEPAALLLDEPTNHLDITHRLDLLEFLARIPATVVAALHDLDLAARHCDHLVLLHAGRVVASGTPEEVLTPPHMERVFGVRSTLRTGPDGRPELRLDRAGLPTVEDGAGRG
ncbi:ABC transporter ATP-binding protein [Streptomyces liangshanensis]|uniref:ABC transporter ATP-binding protein n=1 Tax=Streptomyces liangshanensis TaxID=2717324 RepID=UPI0036DE40EE